MSLVTGCQCCTCAHGDDKAYGCAVCVDRPDVHAWIEQNMKDLTGEQKKKLLDHPEREFYCPPADSPPCPGWEPRYTIVSASVPDLGEYVSPPPPHDATVLSSMDQRILGEMLEAAAAAPAPHEQDFVYLLAEKWYGAIRIGSMTVFMTLDELRDYVTSHTKPGGDWSLWHAYRVYNGKHNGDSEALTLAELRAVGLRPPKEDR